MIDDKISWKSQIKHVQTKMSSCIAVLNKAKQALDHKSLCILYCTLVLPYLIYCAEVWAITTRVQSSTSNFTKESNTDHSWGRIQGSHKLTILTV